MLPVGAVLPSAARLDLLEIMGVAVETEHGRSEAGLRLRGLSLSLRPLFVRIAEARAAIGAMSSLHHLCSADVQSASARPTIAERGISPK
jgi:hypothetical protein